MVAAGFFQANSLDRQPLSSVQYPIKIAQQLPKATRVLSGSNMRESLNV